jgi:hypothetical protein
MWQGGWCWMYNLLNPEAKMEIPAQLKLNQRRSSRNAVKPGKYETTITRGFTSIGHSRSSCLLPLARATRERSDRALHEHHSRERQ